jgi:hypothetical protein
VCAILHSQLRLWLIAQRFGRLGMFLQFFPLATVLLADLGPILTLNPQVTNFVLFDSILAVVEGRPDILSATFSKSLT